MTSKKDHALALAASGFRVFPLAINGKTPANAGSWRKTASSDVKRVAEMWTDPVFDSEQDWNIGVALDRHTLVVDVDIRNGKQGAQSLQLLEAIYDDLPPTYTVTTASGGEHRYYTVDDSDVFAKTLATDIDLKGEGGYVVGPGSSIDGRVYRTRDEGLGDRAMLPEWVREHAPAGRLSKTGNEMREGGTLDSIVELDLGSSVQRAIGYLEAAAPHSGTFRVAARVKDFGIARETCRDLIIEHWPGAEGKSFEHIEFRVNNAYQYGQNAPGIASAEAEFDAVEIDAKPAPKRRGLYVVRWADAKPVLDQPYLIDDVIDLGAMVVTYGDSNAGKTYVKLDQAFHVAAGLDWNGHKVRQGLVVYVAAEGGTGFLKRVEAFKRHYKVDNLPFSLVPCPVDLFTDNADTNKLVKLIREEEKHFGQKCVLVVIDTLARAMAGGDENLAKDMGVFVRNVDTIRTATGATSDIIHHTGKDKAKGARGSSALRAATDTELEVQPGVLSVAKQRDLQKSDDFNFELLSVEVGRRPDGKAVTACVVQWVAVNEFDNRVSPVAMEMLDVLERMVAAEQDRIEEETGNAETNKSDIKIPWAEWQMSLLNCLKGARGKSVNRTTLFGLRRELSESGRIKKDNNNQWFIP